MPAALDWMSLLLQHATPIHATRAMAAGMTKRLWEMSDAVDVLEAWETAST